MTTYEKLKEIISKQTENAKGAPEEMLGRQVLDIASESDETAELILTDIENPGFGISDIKKKLDELAGEKHKRTRGTCICITPEEADAIIRKTYGLTGEPVKRPVETVENAKPQEESSWADLL